MTEREAKPAPRRRPKITPISLILFGLGVLLGCSITYMIMPHFLVNPSLPEIGLNGCTAQLEKISRAMEVYSLKNGDYPQSQHDLVVEGYLPEIPPCPVADRVTYRTAFGAHTGFNKSDDEHYFLVECTGTNHNWVGVSRNCPSIDSVSGLRLHQGWDGQ